MYVCVRAGMRTTTPATGWRRQPGPGTKPRSSVQHRIASWCTLETCESHFIAVNDLSHIKFWRFIHQYFNLGASQAVPDKHVFSCFSVICFLFGVKNR